ncbi:TetR/AcrR family transcriptional regulator [Streptomyces sp. URMC 123]|uniref:TetR/AcrR family transcriptional regulator n=1 Tax=Streptomyces sp. URMC 123 TaxID=3423403 RepID=UPI003F199B55
MAATDRTKGSPRASVWLEGGPAPKRRSEQPSGLDREKIIEATVRLLDSEGLTKFSMRRLAAELGVTAMSVYWYVDTKDDLLELALDAVMAEMRLPDESEGDWRDRLRQLASEYRRLLVTHPWVPRLMGQYLNLGPHALAFSASAQGVLRHAGLPVSVRTGGLAATFQFVYGFGTIEGQYNERCRAAGVSQDEYFQRVMRSIEVAGKEDARLDAVLEDSKEIMEARGGSSVEEMRQRDFANGLDIVIAGIEALSRRAEGDGSGVEPPRRAE